ncbi:metallophosphatase [Mesorhizobium sp. L-8-10]|uniref:CapA family protein n=1 Tax=unclassified Mesorhizobium TaxID=325217 RepID=UPI0019385B27|nr:MULTISPECIES: CapA family protein [unclassified Mesorhizobium]BCH23753.1 metallophosphatase [Mesorhizobium sp. L-8-3]BCH31481.1 metallophosphatase [Mesorhizobium sp. L-8-10]
MSSNFPLSYRLSWLPRFLVPSLGGDRNGFLPAMGGSSRTPPPDVRLVFVGDISAVASGKSPEIDESLRKTISAADLVIGNCESPIVARPLARLGTAVGTRHAMTRSFLEQTLAAAAIDPHRLVLSLANNHALDQGVPGFEQTLETLDRLCVRTIGAARDGFVRTVRAGPARIGLAAFTQWRNETADAFSGRVTTAADFNHGGWAALREAEADFVCAVPHWDREFRHFPEAATRETARRLAASGASLVVGGHAHVVQPAERIGETLVAYSLGDFLGTAWWWCRWPLRISALLSVGISLDKAEAGSRRAGIVSCGMVPFLRSPRGGREVLAPIDMARRSLGRRAADRWRTIFARQQDLRAAASD